MGITIHLIVLLNYLKPAKIIQLWKHLIYVEDRNKLVHSQPNLAEEEFEVFLYVR